MNILTYTSYAEVRATLGMNEIEITDEMLALDMYASSLSLDLDDASLQIQDKFEEVSAIIVTDRTKDEQRFINSTHLFSTYSVAKQLCTSLPMAGPKSISDSKTEVSRFSDSPYKETIKSIKSGFETYKQRAVSALEALSSGTSTLTRRKVMVVSLPSSDPVTG